MIKKLPSLSIVNVLFKASKSYAFALITGYILMSGHIIAQILLTPLYLDILGEEKFGLLMIFLNIITFVVFGIAWFSGGLVRVLGEYWSNKNISKFNETLILGKFIFTSYSIIVSILSVSIFFILKNVGYFNNIEILTILIISLYFVLTYEALPERQAFVAANWQAIGNIIELTKVIAFVFFTLYLLPKYQNIDIVFIALIIGVIIQRVITGSYLKTQLNFSSWERFSDSMKPNLKRFLSRGGLNYFYFGTLVLLLQLDVVIIGIIGGPVLASKFVLLWKIPEVLGLILGKIPTSLEPKIIHLDTKAELNKLEKFFF